MIEQLLKPRGSVRPFEASQRELIDLLRTMVLLPPCNTERFHAVFLDGQRSYLGGAPLGNGRTGSLSVRMRGLFENALAMDARGIIVAHNHPSGLCRPSAFDVEATRKLKLVSEALDVELLDHLIFTQTAVYSMRAGGDL